MRMSLDAVYLSFDIVALKARIILACYNYRWCRQAPASADLPTLACLHYM